MEEIKQAEKDEEFRQYFLRVYGREPEDTRYVQSAYDHDEAYTGEIHPRVDIESRFDISRIPFEKFFPKRNGPESSNKEGNSTNSKINDTTISAGDSLSTQVSLDEMS